MKLKYRLCSVEESSGVLRKDYEIDKAIIVFMRFHVISVEGGGGAIGVS